jgi:hypothetical protein
MKHFVDLVNFNADASCLSSARWLAALDGREHSEFCRWLRFYVDGNKAVTLGLTGATVADLAAHNPEAIALINGHPQVFELIVRPFSHDVSLARSSNGFLLNLGLGSAILQLHFPAITPFFLPPEFMLSSEQVALLAEQGILGIFVNSQRLAPGTRERVPTFPYQVRGVRGIDLRCVPVSGNLTQLYLDALHNYDSGPWRQAILQNANEVVISWRDGESPFLVPDGMSREGWWLQHEGDIPRCHLNATDWNFAANETLESSLLRSYPVHSFLAWMKEFRMMGYLLRLQRLEETMARFQGDSIGLWLQAINSDILSSVEKRSPVVRLKKAPEHEEYFEYTILRSERGFEGEEWLCLLEQAQESGLDPAMSHLAGFGAHCVKLRGRLDQLRMLRHGREVR